MKKAKRKAARIAREKAPETPVAAPSQSSMPSADPSAVSEALKRLRAQDVATSPPKPRRFANPYAWRNVRGDGLLHREDTLFRQTPRGPIEILRAGDVPGFARLIAFRERQGA